jgi:hypothetical protein
MTELERARDLLRENQGDLAYERKYGSDPIRTRYYEGCVLAALSWVWDAQERLIDVRLRRMNENRVLLGCLPIERDDPDIWVLLVEPPQTQDIVAVVRGVS